MTPSTEVLLERVEPYFGEGRQAQPGGSGIHDTEDPAHHYITMPLGSSDLPPEVPEDILQMRRMYFEAEPIPSLGPDDHSGLTDSEGNEEGSSESPNEQVGNSAQQHNLNTEASEAIEATEAYAALLSRHQPASSSPPSAHN